jgi:hypothetical protein
MRLGTPVCPTHRRRRPCESPHVDCTNHWYFSTSCRPASVSMALTADSGVANCCSPAANTRSGLRTSNATAMSGSAVLPTWAYICPDISGADRNANASPREGHATLGAKPGLRKRRRGCALPPHSISFAGGASLALCSPRIADKLRFGVILLLHIVMMALTAAAAWWLSGYDT